MPGAEPLLATLFGALALQVVMLGMLWARPIFQLSWHHEWDTLHFWGLVDCTCSLSRCRPCSPPGSPFWLQVASSAGTRLDRACLAGAAGALLLCGQQASNFGWASRAIVAPYRTG
jgi:hypothetical protein